MVGDAAYNYLYVVYSGYSDDDVSLAGYANADIYKKVSGTGGRNWGPEVNLTNTNTDGCDVGNCESEAWGTVAERVDSFMYVSYVYDLDASSAITLEGGYTENPFRYLKDPRELVASVPGKYFSPSQLISPVRWATNGGSINDALTFENTGTATLYVKISGPSYVTTISPSSFAIEALGAPVTVNLTFNGAGKQDTFLVGQLMVESNNGLLGGGEVYVDTEWVKIHFAVGKAQYVVLYRSYAGPDNLDWGIAELTFTGSTKIKYFNLTVNGTWRIQNMPVLSLQGDTATQTQNFYFGLERGPINYTFKLDAVLSSMPAKVGIPAVVIYEQHIIYPGIKDTVFYTMPPPPEFVVGGEIEDTIQHKHEKFPNQEANSMECTPTAVSNSLKFLNTKHKMGMSDEEISIEKMKIATHWDNGCDPEMWPLYKDSYMKAHRIPITTRRYKRDEIQMDQIIAEIDACQDIELDLTNSPWHTVAIVGIADFEDGRYSVSIAHDAWQDKSGYTIEETGIWDSNTLQWSGLPWVSLFQFVVECPSDTGDANGDGKVTVSDVVYLINYLFKGGPAPIGMYTGDANCDGKVTVSDVVYLINYLFKGGPPPGC